MLSRPHLLDSNVNIDKNGEEIIQGLKPDPEKHDFHIDIFPVNILVKFQFMLFFGFMDT